MEQQDSSNTGSYDKKKNEDDEAEATLPPTDGTTVRNWPDPEWQEEFRRLSNRFDAWWETNKSEVMSKLWSDDKPRYESPFQGMTSRDKDLSASDSPPTVKSSRQLQLPSYSLDRDRSKPNWVLNVPFKDGDIEMGGPHSSDHVNEHNAIEMGGTHSSDGVPGEPRLVDPSSNHHAHEDIWERLATMVDPLLSVNVQGACSLVAYKSSDGSSPAKDVLLYFLVFVYVLGFLSALGGKLYRSSRMQVIGLLAAAVGFLMTMALVVIYKI